MKPACTNCNREMQCTTNGVVVGVVVKRGGTTDLYQCWNGDEYTCPDCKAKVVTNYGDNPTWEPHHEGAAPKVDRMVVSR